MSIAREIRIQKLQNKNHMVGKTFSVLASNERRKEPWLGSAWFVERKDYKTEKEYQRAFVKMNKKRAERISEWHEETKCLLKQNPNLIII